jgi:RimJ/RimL family protein N-acetyltransferase
MVVGHSMEYKNTPIFSSKRVGFFKPTAEDLPFFTELTLNQKVDGGYTKEDEVQDFLDRMIKHWDTHGFGHYLAVLKANSERIGTARITFSSEPDAKIGIPVIGGSMLPEFWAKGLATEGARALLDYAIFTLGFNKLVAYNSPTNLASARLTEKNGFRKIGTEAVTSWGTYYGVCDKWLYVHKPNEMPGKD